MSGESQLQVTQKSGDTSLSLSKPGSGLVARGLREVTGTDAAEAERIADALRKLDEDREQKVAEAAAEVATNIMAVFRWNLEARQRLLLKAKGGDSEAQFQVGVGYMCEAAADIFEALKWLRMAAEQGHSKAQSVLGFSNEFGDDGPPDNVQIDRIRKECEASAGQKGKRA
jgi:TPR repeat protein